MPKTSAASASNDASPLDVGLGESELSGLVSEAIAGEGLFE